MNQPFPPAQPGFPMPSQPAQQPGWPQQPQGFPQQQPQGFPQQQPMPAMPPAQMQPMTPAGGQPGAPMLPPQQPAFAPQQPVAQYAQNNLLVGYMSQPARAPIVREKPADGTSVIVMLNGPAGCKVDFSQKNGQPYLLVRYQVVESTVPQMVGRQFGYPMPFVLKNQQEAIADLAKALFGMQYMQQLIQSGVTTAQALAQFVVQQLQHTQFYVLLYTRRNQKQLRQGTSYDEAFVNHNFLLGFTQPVNLATAIQQAQAAGIQVPVQAAMAPAGAMPFAPPAAAPQQAMPPQAPGVPMQPPAPMASPQQPGVYLPPSAAQPPPAAPWPGQSPFPR